ncbi:MAG: hypothetical protein ABGY75_03440 [Gemmataceae bacterium]
MSRLCALIVSLLGLTAAPALAAPFTFVGGKAYLEANVNGSANSGGSTALGASNSFLVMNGFGPPLASNRASAQFSHATSGTVIDILGNTFATRSGASSTAFGLSAGNLGDPGGTRDYGYYVDFSVTESTGGLLNIGYTATRSSSDAANNWTYTDVYGYLLNLGTNETWDFGRYDENNSGVPGSGSGGSLGGASFPYYIPFLAMGNYRLYLQSQSFVQGTSGSASAEANIRITLTAAPAAVPEPLSIAVFGGVIASGLIVCIRSNRLSDKM